MLPPPGRVKRLLVMRPSAVIGHSKDGDREGWPLVYTWRRGCPSCWHCPGGCSLPINPQVSAWVPSLSVQDCVWFSRVGRLLRHWVGDWLNWGQNERSQRRRHDGGTAEEGDHRCIITYVCLPRYRDTRICSIVVCANVLGSVSSAVSSLWWWSRWQTALHSGGRNKHDSNCVCANQIS